MCYFSLEHIGTTRLAEENENLVCRAAGTYGSRGMFSPSDAKCTTAVCIPHGTQINVIKSTKGVGPATFVQTSLNANSYRDAIDFGDGNVVNLQQLEGMEIQIISLDMKGEAPFIADSQVLVAS